MKKRLDILVTEKGITTSREKAKALIMAGQIFVDNVREDKAGSMFEETCDIVLHGEKPKYVSRGGLKLEKAMASFPIKLDDFVCMDIGSSTGGFTDCMLQNGAKRVFAVDVGYGQLDYKLRVDERVVCMEKTNIRYVTPEDIGEPLDFASCDVSFISLDKVLPAAINLLKDEAEMVCLIKPQFEAGREEVGKKGVVRDPKIHQKVIEKVLEKSREIGFSAIGLTYSPVKGPEGNIEYLVHLKKGEFEGSIPEPKEVVNMAHEELDK